MIPPSSSSLLSFLSCYAVDRQARTHFSSSFNSSIRSKMLVARTTLIFVLVTLSTVVAKTPDNVSSRLMIHVSSCCIRALTLDGVQTEKRPKSCNHRVQISTTGYAFDVTCPSAMLPPSFGRLFTTTMLFQSTPLLLQNNRRHYGQSQRRLRGHFRHYLVSQRHGFRQTFKTTFSSDLE
jgi:hypothetical protein